MDMTENKNPKRVIKNTNTRPIPKAQTTVPDNRITFGAKGKVLGFTLHFKFGNANSSSGSEMIIFLENSETRY